MNDAELAVLTVQGAHDGQHDGVIAAESEGAAAVGDDCVVGFLDDFDAGREVEGVNSDVADVGDL